MFDDKHEEAIPQGLDEMEPGPVLAAFLSSIDAGGLSAYDRVVVLRAHQRMASHYSARVYESMAAVSDSVHEMDDAPQLAIESTAAEIRAALQLTRRAADSELSLALDLRRRLPRVWKLLAAGDIDIRRVRAISHATGHLPIGMAQEVIDRVIDDAPGLTTGQLTARIRRLCIDADPQDAERRYGEAIVDRRIVCEPTDAGTANLLGLDLPPHRLAAINRRINQFARKLRTGGESRTMDQLRADVLMDLLDGTSTSSGSAKGVVDIHVDLDTLAGLADHAGELAGYGPVIADIARQVALDQFDSEWRYTVTDPDTGQVLDNGTTRRRPTVNQRRHVGARHPTCVFPGCRMPATDCDLDHRIPIRRVDPPSPPTWLRCAATITASAIMGGPTNPCPTAATAGRASSATPTPPAARRLSGPRGAVLRSPLRSTHRHPLLRPVSDHRALPVRHRTAFP